MLKIIPFDKLVSNGNVRNEKDETLNELIESIQRDGLLQPLAVRKLNGDQYEIVAGHRRYEALRRIGEPYIECNILEEAEPKDVVFLQISENVQRNQMSAYELVQCFDELKEQNHLTNAQIAKRLNKTESWVIYQYNAVRSLNALYGEKKMPEEAKKLSAGQIQFRTDKIKKGEFKSVIGNGYSCKIHGHTYQMYFSNFEAETNFIRYMKEHGANIGEED